MDGDLDLGRLRALVELERRGTMAAVGAATGYGTSAVSQQLAALQRQVGVTLFEADGRRVRLTLPGRRLAAHGARILADVTAATLDLRADSAPHGVVRVAAYTTAARMLVVPALAELADAHPLVQVQLLEAEPSEMDELLDADRIDLGFTYDYTLAPRIWTHTVRPIASRAMVLVVPPEMDLPDRIASTADLDALRDVPWIGNSRNTGDDELAARLCALAGWAPVVGHQADSLSLVIDLVLAGHGVAILPTDSPEVNRGRLVPIDIADIRRRMWAITRPGMESWPAIAAVTSAVEHATAV
ncbi:LysR family transcriptional regulator [Naasia lichenicola]|nr:LysR family transcriptional regulator [Naasia lichenicola]